MLDTSNFETDVVITKVDSEKRPLQISLINGNKETVGIQKFRVKKSKPKTGVTDLNEY